MRVEEARGMIYMKILEEKKKTSVSNYFEMMRKAVIMFFLVKLKVYPRVSGAIF